MLATRLPTKMKLMIYSIVLTTLVMRQGICDDGLPKETEALKRILSVVNSPDLYDKDIPPYRSNDSIVVTAQFNFYNVVISMEHQQCEIDVKMELRWKDTRFNFTELGEYVVSLYDMPNLWLPDIHFYDAAVAMETSGLHTDQVLYIYDQGEFKYRARLYITSKLDSSLQNETKFKCEFKYGSYASDEKLLFFKHKDDELMSNFWVALDDSEKGYYAFKYFAEYDSSENGGYIPVMRITLLPISMMDHKRWLLCSLLTFLASTTSFVFGPRDLFKKSILIVPFLFLGLHMYLDASTKPQLVPYANYVHRFLLVSVVFILVVLAHAVAVFLFYPKKSNDENEGEKGKCSPMRERSFWRALSVVSKILIVVAFAVALSANYLVFFA